MTLVATKHWQHSDWTVYDDVKDVYVIRGLTEIEAIEAANDMSNTETYRPTLDVSDGDGLAQDLYPIFVALVDWSRKTGRTEINAERAARSALQVIGASDALITLIHSRYRAGSRATAELDHEGKL